ncbi:MAG: hypothetical protein RMX65_004645 [Nostoc sp. DedQUE01]|nr:hypothetical protein [Nostoc sp. DedQUE01]
MILSYLRVFELKILLLDIIYRNDSYGIVDLIHAIAPNGIYDSRERLSACCMG